MKKYEKVYKKNSDFVTRKIDDDLILMPIYKTASSTNELFTLNETAAALWGLVDGKTSLGSIIDKLCTTYKGNREKIEKDLGELIKDMKEIKAIIG